MAVTRFPTMEDIKTICDELTPEDLREYRASCPRGSLLFDLDEYRAQAKVRGSEHFMMAVESSSGALLAVGGMSLDTGVCWFLTTVHAKYRPKELLRVVKAHRDIVWRYGKEPQNTMMLSNRLHKKLLVSLGAEFVGPIFSMGGEPFQRFIIHRKETDHV